MTSEMQKTIISDASCLILLDKIGHIEILHKLFGSILTTGEVAKEFDRPLPEWIHLQEPSDKNYQTIIETSLDKGEASAIALAVEMEDCLLIIDELKGRRFAMQMGLKITGTLGILVDAKETGLIEFVKPLLEQIKQTNFRVSDQIEQIILNRAGE
jgi:predicted nucleic acid-binding protein